MVTGGKIRRSTTLASGALVQHNEEKTTPTTPFANYLVQNTPRSIEKQTLLHSHRSNKRHLLERKFDIDFSIYARDILNCGGVLCFEKECQPELKKLASSETSMLLLSAEPVDTGGGGDCLKQEQLQKTNLENVDIGHLSCRVKCQRTPRSGKGIELTIELISRPVLPISTTISVSLEQILPEYCFHERLFLQHMFSEHDKKLGPITIVPEAELEGSPTSEQRSTIAAPNDWHCPGCDSWQDKLMCDNCTAGETIYYCFFCHDAREFGVFAYNDDECDDGADRCPTCHAFNIHSLRFTFLNPHGNLRCRIKIDAERIDALENNQIEAKWAPFIADSDAWHDRSNEIMKSLTDFKIVARDLEHKVHKSIVASRCDYFRRMISHKCREAQQNVWHIDCSPQCAAHLIYYFYTDLFPVTTTCDASSSSNALVFELLTVANMYDLERLKNQCEAFLYPQIAVKNVCQILVIADMMHARQLREYAASFCQHYLHDIMQTEGWEQMCHPKHCHLVFLVTLGRELPARKTLVQKIKILSDEKLKQLPMEIVSETRAMQNAAVEDCKNLVTRNEPFLSDEQTSSATVDDFYDTIRAERFAKLMLNAVDVETKSENNISVTSLQTNHNLRRHQRESEKLLQPPCLVSSESPACEASVSSTNNSVKHQFSRIRRCILATSQSITEAATPQETSLNDRLRVVESINCAFCDDENENDGCEVDDLPPCLSSGSSSCSSSSSDNVGHVLRKLTRSRVAVDDFLDEAKTRDETKIDENEHIARCACKMHEAESED